MRNYEYMLQLCKKRKWRLFSVLMGSFLLLILPVRPVRAYEGGGMYYLALNEEEQKVYLEFLKACQEMEVSFVPSLKLSEDEIYDIYFAILADHPECFWLNTSGISFGVQGEICTVVYPGYTIEKEELSEKKEEFAAAAEELIAGCASVEGLYEMERALHDSICDSVSYDETAANGQTAYGALVEKAAVCSGYARAFQYLCAQVGIPCYYCEGTASGNHAWNIVGLGEEFYHVDTVWDDTGGIRYAFFNRTEEDIADRYQRAEACEILPACTGSTYHELESSLDTYGMESMEDYGFTEEDAITSLDQYYQKCYEMVVRHGPGEYTEYLLIAGEDLCKEIFAAYEDTSYQQGYLIPAMEDGGLIRANVHLEGMSLRSGYYLFSHDFSAN